MLIDGFSIDFRAAVEALPEGVALVADSEILYSNEAYRALGEAGRVDPVLRPEVSYGSRRASLRITRRASEREALEARLQSGAQLVSVGAIACSMAHQINNPLAAATIGLELLEQELVHAAEVGRVDLASFDAVLEETGAGIARVRAIVRDLRSCVRPDPEAPHGVAVEPVLESAIALVSNELQHKAKLVRQYGRVPAVLADEGRLQQVFLNLLLHAAGSVDEGGLIRLAIYEKDGRVAIEIHDSGAGIAPELLPRIFDPFVSTKAFGEGTGLGLAICHGIVTQLGGEIEAESDLGLGTSLRVLLPIAPGTGA